MCYDDNAQPPVPPGVAGPATGEDTILTAADGNRFAAYRARPAGPATAAVVIYPDVRGLHGFYKDLALRFAETGIAAVAFDYFGRTAGLSARDDRFAFRPHVEALTLAGVLADAAAAHAALPGGRAGAPAPFAVGFCLGGSLAILTGTTDLPLRGVVGFYAGLLRDMDGAGTVLARAAGIRRPVLGLFGGADAHIPPEQLAELDAQLGRAGVAHDIVVYPGAPHSFFDRQAAAFAAESADAWRRVLAFIGSGDPVAGPGTAGGGGM